MDNVDAQKLLKQRLMRKIKYNEDIHGKFDEYEFMLDDLVYDSKYITLSLKYPFLEDYTNVEVPKKYINWQYRCCLELYQDSGSGKYTSYSENGLSWSKAVDGLSVSLKDEIISHVGVPQREE